MSEENKKKEEKNQADSKNIDINVQLENKSLDEIMKILEEERKKREELEKKLTAMAQERESLEAKMEELKLEAEDYKTKLQMIAEQEFEKKKKALIERAKQFIKDEEKLKQMEEEITDPDKLKATEFMIDTLAEALAKGAEEEEKKKKEEESKEGEGEGEEGEEGKEKEGATAPASAPAGSAPLTPAQTGATEKTGEYESYEAMIRDLYRRQRSKDPEEAAEAKAILDELFRKWANAVKKRYEGKLPQGIRVEKGVKIKDILRKGGGA